MVEIFNHSKELRRLIFDICFQVGMATRRGGVEGSKDGIFVPIPHGIVLPHPRPAPHDGENFLTPSPTLGAPRSPAPSCKTLLFLLIFPTISTIFFNETYFINKNILKITTKFIPSIQINF